MKRRSHWITAIAWLFIAVGCIGILRDLMSLATSHGTQGVADLEAEGPVGLAVIWGVRLLAVAGGAFLLYGFHWARWLLAAWMVFHIVVAALHSPPQLLLHTAIFAALGYLLFRPQASAYFRGAREP